MNIRTTILLGSAFAVTQCFADEEGFLPLFDGKSLEGWEGAVEGYMIADGMLVCREGAVGNLLTQREYGDFELRFEFLLSSDANNGLAIRAPLGGDAAYVGMEVQIIDNETKKFGELLDYQYHGSLYGIAPAKQGFQKPTGEWNQQEVSCVGRQITVVLNGHEILNVNLDKVAPGGVTIDHKEHPGLLRSTGRVGFLSHGDKVSFKNIRIKERGQKRAIP